MQDSQKRWHILCMVLLSISYTIFIIQLTDPSSLTYLYLMIYFCLFFIYTLKVYSMFNFPPSQPNMHSTNFDMELIFQFKKVQERKRELQYLLEQQKQQNKSNLQKQYLDLLRKPSFCDICERVQPSRSSHCLFCDTCIIGKHKHSKLLGFCIGENNQQIYLLYLMISKILLGYCLITILFAHFYYRNIYYKLATILQVYQGCFQLALLGLFAYFLRQFCIFFSHVRHNVTLIQRDIRHLRQIGINPFGQPKHKISYFSCLKKLIECQSIGQVSVWIAQTGSLNNQM